jgi:hypothetical protein
VIPRFRAQSKRFGGIVDGPQIARGEFGIRRVASTILRVDDSAFDLDLAVSSLRADGSDVQLMLRLLTEKLAAVLGERLRVTRAGGLLRRSNAIEKVEVRLRGCDLEARCSGASAEFLVGQVSGGIRIRTEHVDAADWTRRLLEELQTEATHSSSARQALEAIMIG